MARRRVQIDIGELQDAINQLEAAKLFTSPHKLYEAIAETPWARAFGATAATIYTRIKEVNVDLDNPVITMRVKRARRAGTTKATGVALVGFDVLIDAFQGRGIEVDSVKWLVTSSQKSDAENRAIRLAWADLRDTLGLPKPVKKLGAPEVEDLAIHKPDDGNGTPDGVLPDYADYVTAGFGTPEDSGTEVQIDVIEQMPDGGFVQPQVVIESEISAAPVVVQIRPVQSRPIPVRSSVPPRPMPIIPGK